MKVYKNYTSISTDYDLPTQFSPHDQLSRNAPVATELIVNHPRSTFGRKTTPSAFFQLGHKWIKIDHFDKEKQASTINHRIKARHRHFNRIETIPYKNAARALKEYKRARKYKAADGNKRKGDKDNPRNKGQLEYYLLKPSKLNIFTNRDRAPRASTNLPEKTQQIKPPIGAELPQKKELLTRQPFCQYKDCTNRLTEQF